MEAIFLCVGWLSWYLCCVVFVCIFVVCWMTRWSTGPRLMARMVSVLGIWNLTGWWVGMRWCEAWTWQPKCHSGGISVFVALFARTTRGMRLTIVYLMNGRFVQQMMSHLAHGIMPRRHKCRNTHHQTTQHTARRTGHISLSWAELNEGNSSSFHDVPAGVTSFLGHKSRWKR